MSKASHKLVEVDARPANRPTRREKTERALIQAARKVFLKRGYDGATTGEIARAAGVAAGTFYLYFGDKRSAFGAVSRETGRKLLAEMLCGLEPGVDPGKLTRLTLQLVADFWRSDPPLSRLILSGGPAIGMASDHAFADEVCEALQEIGVADQEDPMALSLFLIGLSLQIGHLIVARPEAEDQVQALIELAAQRF